MKHSDTPPVMEQLDLFQALPQRPKWTQIPKTARDKVLELLSQALMDAALAMESEVDDE